MRKTKCDYCGEKEKELKRMVDLIKSEKEIFVCGDCYDMLYKRNGTIATADSFFSIFGMKRVKKCKK
jgi:hypothetical protein